MEGRYISPSPESDTHPTHWTCVVLVSVLSVSWSVICCQDGCFMVYQRRIAEEYLIHNLDENCLETRLDAFPTPVGGQHSWVREIDCGNWLARGCMAAHQHCELFYPPAEDSIGSTLNQVGSVIRSGQWVLTPDRRIKFDQKVCFSHFYTQIQVYKNYRF